MRRLVNLAALNPDFREHIYRAARELELREVFTPRAIHSLLNYLFSDYVYIADPFIEYYVRPEHFVAMPMGDCDDASLYAASILTTLRVPNDFCFVFKNKNLTHVYTRGKIGKKVVNFDYAKIGDKK